MRRTTYRLLATAVFATGLPGLGLAADRTYVGVNSWWDFAANWSPSGLPQAGDIVRITTSGATDNYCHYRSANPSWVYGTFYVQSTNGGTAWLWDETTDPATALNAGALNLAYDGKGHILQKVGAWSFSGASYIGRSAGSDGQYELLGGSVNFGNSLSIGSSGLGYFKQTTGTNSIAGGLAMAFYSAGSATYDLLGGTLNSGDSTADDVMVGRGGIGLFHHYGGTHNLAGDLILGNDAGSHGEYWQESGGVTSPTLSCVNATVGVNGNGLWRMGGGSATLSGVLSIAANSGSGADMVVNTSTLTAASAAIAAAGSGSLTVTGSSTVTINNDLTIAGSGGTGTLDLNGGTTEIKRQPRQRQRQFPR